MTRAGRPVRPASESAKPDVMLMPFAMTPPVSGLGRFLAPCGKALAVAFSFSCCINLLMLTAPLYMLQIYERVLASHSVDTLLLLTFIAGFAFVTLAILEFVRSEVMLRTGLWLERRVGPCLLAASTNGSVNEQGSTPHQLLSDGATLRNFITGASIYSFMDAPWSPVFIFAIFLLHPMLGWLSLCGALAVLCLAVLNERLTRRQLALSSSDIAVAQHFAEAAMRNSEAVNSMGQLPGVLRKWSAQNDVGLASLSSAGRRNGAIRAVTKFVRLFLQVVTLGLGAWLVLQNEMSAGGMIAGSILLGRALAPVDQAIASWRSASLARDAFGRLRCLSSIGPGPAQRMRLPKPMGQLSSEAATFLHPGAQRPVLRNITFMLEAGRCLGIIGPSGAGKSTLGRLIVGSAKPHSGTIRLDGIDMFDWHSDERGQYVGYLPQDTGLLPGTFAENISRFRSCEPAEIIEAATLVGVHEFILRQPNGYDTHIGDGGFCLSAGQRQRIGLARAVFGNPSLVVLDEPNSNLDHDGEAALITAIETLRSKGVTTVIIAHRPIVLRSADTVLVLRDGAVEQLDAKDTVFRKLLGSQARTGEQSLGTRSA